jgi:serine/threonine-protein kinase RsbW
MMSLKPSKSSRADSADRNVAVIDIHGDLKVQNRSKHRNEKLRLKIESQTDNLILVRDLVADAARKFGFNDDDVHKIILAVDEACTNIIKHAYHNDPNKDISINIDMHDGRFTVVIRDKGKHFDPDRVSIPDMNEYLKQYRVGGLGMYLMKKLMDEVEYDIRPGIRNEVRLTKYLARKQEHRNFSLHT